MVVKKTLLSSLCLALWTSVVSAGTAGDQSSAMSLQELREKCLEYSQNQQYKEFKMKIECSGRYTYFEETKKTFSLSNEAKMNAQTTTKSGIFQTDEKEYLKETTPYQASCSVWEKKEMLAPEGMGVPVSITSCEQLTTEYVQNRCAEELKDYCEDNFVARSAGKSTKSDTSGSSADGKDSVAGMCSLSTVEVVDTCSMYTN